MFGARWVKENGQKQGSKPNADTTTVGPNGETAVRVVGDSVEDAWAFELRENPLRATSVGHHENNHLLPSVSTEDETRRAEARGGFLERLRTIDRSQLAPADRISYDMFERELADALSEFVFQSFQIPVNADSGFHIAFSQLPSRMPFNTTKDYENLIGGCPA